MNKSQRVALFTSHGMQTLFPHGEYAEKWQEYARITEYVEIVFPPLPTNVVVENQLASLDTQEKELRLKFQDALDKIAFERGKVLALTHTPEPECPRCKDTKLVTRPLYDGSDADDQPCPDCVS